MIFFLNSTARVYDDTELNKLPGLLFSTGVFNTQQATHALWQLAGDFLVEPAGSTMNVTAKPGAATVNVLGNVGSTPETQRVVIQEDYELTASVASNPSLAIRADAVVLRVDQSIITDDDLNAAGSNAVSLVVISGNSANALSDTEISVALSNDPFIRLADIFVPQNATEITEAMITDRRELATMTRTLKMGSDVFRFFAVTDDPENPAQGDVWYNSTEGILKMRTADSTIALQSQSFDWGYYPPGGIDTVEEQFEPVAENEGLEGVSADSLYFVLILGDVITYLSSMSAQIFNMPNINNPFLRIKMGNPTWGSTPTPSAARFSIYAADVDNEPTGAVIETFNFAVEEVPVNDYLSIYLDGSLYTPGNKYMIVAQPTTTGFINGSDADARSIQVLRSSHEADDVFVGFKTANDDTLQSNPASMDWAGGLSTGNHWVMSFQEREELEIGQTDASGNVHELSQAFIPKSKDITGFGVIKGINNGSPTGDINASLYLADNDNNAVGDVLTSGSLTNAEWEAADVGDYVYFPISYDDLVVGQRYVVIIDCDDIDDDNNYTMYFGTVSSGGKGKFFNTADGWTDFNGDLFYSIRTSPVRKIVVTDNQGLIPANLIPKSTPRVTYIESSAAPVYNVETADAICITEQGVNITSMSDNQFGTPQDFQRLIFRILDDGGARTISWGSLFANKGGTMPTSTTAGKLHTVTFEYDAVTEKWGCIAAVTEA